MHYEVELSLNTDAAVFDGSVTINLTYAAAKDLATRLEETFSLSLNAKNLIIHSASLTQLSEPIKYIPAAEISLNAEIELVTLLFPFRITSESAIAVRITFTGILNASMAGFYKSTYTDRDGMQKTLFVTQCCPTDCRQIFPCFDEPAHKATFDFSLVVNENMTVLANTSVTSTLYYSLPMLAIDKKVKKVTFARTPPMSTYLVAFAVGELEFIEAVASPLKPDGVIPIKVRRKGNVSQGRFALNVAVKSLEYLSEYFNEAFPLPKSDFLAVPDFAFGAMENWGLITYRNDALLCDEASATSQAKKMIASTVCHELSHMWFGNLVTMEWWNDIWLNEGFATFVGWQITDFLFPEWNVWTDFITGSFSGALQLDGLKSSHPIEVPVKSAAEIGQIFDAISYLKGASVIRMLNDFLGTQVFMDGVRSYLQEFKYKNAVTADLWKHLSLSSGVNVSKLMNNWTKKTGFPLITVDAEYYNSDNQTMTIDLSQSRFISSGNNTFGDNYDNETVWWVPLAIVSHLTRKIGPTKHVLNGKTGSVTFPYSNASAKDSFWKLNFESSGVYRVAYQQQQLDDVCKILKSQSELFSVADRIMFLNDTMALVTAGKLKISVILDMILALEHETDYHVLNQIATTLSSIRSMAYRESEELVQSGLKRLGLKVFAPKLDGFEYPPNEEYFDKLRRGLVISICSSCNDRAVISELKSRFVKVISGENSNALDPELRTIAFGSVLANVTGPEEARTVVDAILKWYTDIAQVQEKTRVLSILGSVDSEKEVDWILNELVFDLAIVRSQDFSVPLLGVAAVGKWREKLFQWFFEHWVQLMNKFEGNGRMLGGIFDACVSSCLGEDVIRKVYNWVEGDGMDQDLLKRHKKALAEFTFSREQSFETVRNKTALTKLFEGPLVPRIGYGAMGLSQSYEIADRAESLAVLQRIADEYVAFIDTANVYGNGYNEELIGEWLA
ncbi:hypothetical protein HK100_011529 [Physocladia obscura]|uniref:Aminopeptidase n=1 Tax=Physocladia obscura TaxID=109957 RepID=A0AAD5XI88_9FUNG|nr:hypothetical protein HK100_011529 [Physocladia obscura]